MPYIKDDETYYDILKVNRKATVAEIVAAYHSAKNAFSKDSVATYSLFNNDEAQTVLSKLEEAYLTLSNFEKRADYDRILALKSQNVDVPTLTELELKQKAQLLPDSARPQNTSNPKSMESKISNEPPQPVDALNGTMLKGFREKRALSLEDVSRITKIPIKSLKALEADVVKDLPARVYVQGFVKNLAALYKLDSQGAVKAYLAFLDQSAAPPEAAK